MQGKGGSLGVGRGRAAMRGKVSDWFNSQDTLFLLLSLLIVLSLNLCDVIVKAPATGRGTGGRGAVPPVRR